MKRKKPTFSGMAVSSFALVRCRGAQTSATSSAARGAFAVAGSSGPSLSALPVLARMKSAGGGPDGALIDEMAKVVAAGKLWNEAKHSKTLDPALQAFETPYVVKMHNALPLAPAKLTFTFKHPNPDWPDSIDNTRSVSQSVSQSAR